MQTQKKWTTNQISLAIGIPLILIFLYFAFTSKPATTKPPVKIVEFRVTGQNENKATKKWGVDLLWTVQNADEVTIEPGIGKVEESGTKTVEIDKNTTFVLKAVNPKGPAEHSLEIELPVK
jgi:hypothetical protein